MGCDVLGRLVKNDAGEFQSTHPRGVRHIAKVLLISVIAFQSTHPRGVRQPITIWLSVRVRFQSTHPRGVRRSMSGTLSYSSQFQSTHPRGVRLISPRSRTGLKRYFNPRTHVGCDLPTDIAAFVFLYISIHAPTWGATSRI